MLKILFAVSEVHPLLKTGGLADVAASLPQALSKLGQDVRIVMPAYASAIQVAEAIGVKEVTRCMLEQQQVIIWQTRLPGTRVKVWLVDLPAFSQREGNPYCGPDGRDWPDNAERFYHFCRIVCLLAQNKLSQSWQPDIVHCNDWQTGLIPALLATEEPRPATLFTIHNLAYQGVFPRTTFDYLQLPAHWWSPELLEFYDQFSFMKGGLVYADRITTVSPSYAQEIQTSAHGCGLEGLLHHRRNHLSGILNGIDCNEWNPGSDPHIAQTYNRRTLGNKQKNKSALQARTQLTEQDQLPLLGFIGRLVEQKGIDLLLDVLPPLLESTSVQCVILGSGGAHYESALQKLAERYPQSLAVTIGYDETLAHQIEAGADIFLMPSAYEPCGLNQLYSLRYGTVPIVHGVGGLRDSVMDMQEETDETANGFVFTEYSADALAATIQRALTAFTNKAYWQQLQRKGMSGDFSWSQSARQYLELYQSLPLPVL